MYLRFVSPLRSQWTNCRKAGVHNGILQAAFECRNKGRLDPHLHAALVEEIEWFKYWLYEPDEDCFHFRYKRSHHYESICWFKDSASDMLAHGWTLAGLLYQGGYPICLRKSRNPGDIVYEDDHQIVAYPKRMRDVAFC